LITSFNFGLHTSTQGPQLILFHVHETWIPSWVLDAADLFMHFGNLSFNHFLSVLKKLFNTISLVRSLFL
ncbi:hypothetical protein VIGAN_11089200, partial [Vigna angularis var. angularis]